MQQGYVYILISPAFPDLLKIGMTTRTPEERAKELSKGTGVPASFVVAYSELVNNCSLAESLLHEKFHNYRYMQNREFFKLSLKDAIRITEELLRSNGLNYSAESKELSDWWFSLNDTWQRMFMNELEIVDENEREGFIPTQADLGSIQYFHCDDCTISDLNPLLYLPNLTKLTIGYPEETIRIPDFSAMEQLSNISELCLGYCNHKVTDLRPIKKLKSLKRLHAEDLPLEIIQSLESLETIYLSSIKPDADYKLISNLNHLHTLSLYVTCGADNKIIIPNFEPLECLPNLRELNIIWGAEYFDTNTFYSISSLRQLKKLDIHCSGSLITQFFSSLENLESLSIGGDFATTPDFSLLGNLSTLEIIGSTMYQYPRKRFSLESLIGLQNLRYLKLVAAKFYDFSAIYALSSLEEIDLSGTEIVDLVPLYHLPNLKKLRIVYMPLLYPEQVLELQEANPMCEVEYSQKT